jgi:hypothetical protein
MSYRDVSESLRGYRDRIANDLEEARGAAKEAAERAQRVAILERELAETEDLLAKMVQTKRGLPMLDDIHIAAPCTARWEEMLGDEHVRFCGQCEKNVYNLSSLTRDEAEALLAAREGRMCVRLYRRTDGTVLTEDCPVGARARRRRRAAMAMVGGGLMAAAAALSARGAGTARPTMGEPAPVAMGSAVVDPIPTPTTTTEATTTPIQGHWVAGGIGRAMPAPTNRPPSSTKPATLMGRPAMHH